jgi:glutathione synthase/RimK-type ligase-like ATP-grasp enzyme
LGSLRYILIFSPRDDTHSNAVACRIREIGNSNFEPIIVDSACFPIGNNMSLWFGENLDRGQLKLVEALPWVYSSIAYLRIKKAASTSMTLIKLKDIHAILWRRTRPSIVDPTIDVNDFRNYVQASTGRTLQALIEILSDTITVVNSPIAERRAELKALQLKLAISCGLRVPKTIISNNPDEIRRFVKVATKSGIEIIYKPVTSIPGVYYHTQLLNKLKSRLADTRFCPTIFQERLIGPDVRIICVGRRLFGLLQEPKDEAGKVDIRLDSSPRFTRYEVPPDIAKCILALQHKLGLLFGAYDFKLADNNLIFLEVNPSGQWLWVEIHGRWPIAEGLARLLIGGGSDKTKPIHPFTADALRKLGPLPISEIFPRSVSVASSLKTKR